MSVDGQKKSARIPEWGERFFYVWAIGWRLCLFTDPACGFWDFSIELARDLTFRLTEFRVWDAPLA